MTIPSIEPVVARARFANDPYRPRYHYISPANQLKDPTAPIFWEGEYHLFYDYNPYGAYDDVKMSHWGHTVSDDLVHWRDLPIIMGPTPGGPDRLGCFSGGSIIWNGTPTLSEVFIARVVPAIPRIPAIPGIPGFPTLIFYS